MKKNKIILIGGIRKGKEPICGETMKNQLFIKRFSELFDKVIAIDTYNWKKRPWCLIEIFFILLFNRKAKVIISASGASRYLIHFLYKIPLNKKVYFWVVGGNLSIGIKKGRYNFNALKNLKHIVVQGTSMVDDLLNFGLTNGVYIPNSKPIDYIPSLRLYKEFDIFRFVFLSRIHPDKGIKEIFEAIKILDNQGLKNNYSLDFYGKIDNDFNNDFNYLLANCDNVEYKGFLNLSNTKNYNLLSNYDCMLFPTYWSGEGFPGVVIDANISGIPIIATDWNLNKTIIKQGLTGSIIPIHDSMALALEMIKYIKGDYNVNTMKSNCVDFAKQFDFRKVLSEEVLRNIELYDNKSF